MQHSVAGVVTVPFDSFYVIAFAVYSLAMNLATLRGFGRRYCRTWVSLGVSGLLGAVVAAGCLVLVGYGANARGMSLEQSALFHLLVILLAVLGAACAFLVARTMSFFSCQPTKLPGADRRSRPDSRPIISGVSEKCLGVAIFLLLVGSFVLSGIRTIHGGEGSSSAGTLSGYLEFARGWLLLSDPLVGGVCLVTLSMALRHSLSDSFNRIVLAGGLYFIVTGVVARLAFLPFAAVIGLIMQFAILASLSRILFGVLTRSGWQ